MMKKQLLLILSVIMIAVMMFGCGAPSGGSGGSAAPTPAPEASGGSSGAEAPATPAPEQSATFNIITGDSMQAIDPHNLNGPADRQVMKMCYETLIDTDHYGNAYGVLADSWEFNEDCTELTIVLREGVEFSDGEPFNADVALYNIERVLAHKDDFAVPINWFMNLLRGEKVDDKTVKMVFSQPSPLITGSMTDFVMIPMKMHQELGDQMFADIKNNGTGPWIWDEWVSGQHAHFTKNENYRDIDTYNSYFTDGYIRFMTEPSSAAGAQLSGDADMYISMGGIGNDVLALYAGSEDKIEIVTKEDMFSYLDIRLGFPEGSPTYDAKVREAIDLAIDRQLLADQITGSGVVPNGPLVEGCIGYDASMAPYEFNPEKAKQLLEESSYNGEELTVLGYPNVINAEDYTLAVTSMLQDVGFNVVPEMYDLVTFNEEKDKGEWHIMPASALVSDANPGPFFNSRYISDFMKAGFEGPDADALLEICNTYLTEIDPAVRAELAKEANNWLKDFHGPELAVAGISASWAQNYGIKGIVMYPDCYWSSTFIDWDPSLIPA